MSAVVPDPAGADAHRLNLIAGIASVAVAVTLVALKLWALAATGALSVAASLADSALDLAASLAALIGIRYAARPPDEDHSFGHTSVEDLVALGQSVIVAALGRRDRLERAAPARDAARARRRGRGHRRHGDVAAHHRGLVAWQTRVARRTGSKIVAADRLHYLSDLLPNLGAIVALGGVARFGVLLARSGDRAGRLRGPAALRRADRDRRLARADGPPGRPRRDRRGRGGAARLSRRRGLARPEVAHRRRPRSSCRSMSRSTATLSLRDAHAIAASLRRDILHGAAAGRRHHPPGPGLTPRPVQAAASPRCSSSASTPGSRPRNAT